MVRVIFFTFSEWKGGAPLKKECKPERGAPYRNRVVPGELRGKFGYLWPEKRVFVEPVDTGKGKKRLGKSREKSWLSPASLKNRRGKIACPPLN